MRTAVAGATGRVGGHVVDVLKEQGHEVVAMSRSAGVDVISGRGLDQAVSGVDCIIDTATGPSPDKDAATEFFTVAAGNLHGAGQRAGVRQMVVVSIIGCDRYSGGYNAAKVAHEEAMRSGPIPVRVLRAAQFHEFVPLLMEWGTQGEVSYVSKMRTQLVAARTVAEALVELATDPESSLSEVAGPREETLADAARLLVAKRGDHLRVEEASDPDGPDHGLDAMGALLPGPDARLAGPTFEEWLDVAGRRAA